MDSLGIEMWFQSDQESGTLLFKKDGSGDDQPFLSIDIANSNLRFRGKTQDGNSFELQSPTENLSNWNHLGAYIQSDSVTLYLNGIKKASVAKPSGQLPRKRYIWLGREGNNIFPDINYCYSDKEKSSNNHILIN